MVKRTGKKALGVILIIIGLAALVTPLTPGAWLALAGLELLGIRLVAKDRVMAWFDKKSKSSQDQKPPEV